MGRIMFGITKPRQPVLGTELAGEVESVGNKVKKFEPGDQVFAFSSVSMGCHAEFNCMPEDGLVVLMPDNLTYDEAAALSFGGTTALNFFKRGNLQRGEKVLVNGASGGVGTAAIQLAKYFGAEVTGVCSSGNLGLVESLGAAKVIDYASEDFTKNGETYDIIMDTAGTAPFSRSKISLNEGGRLLQILGGLPDILKGSLISLTHSRKVIAGPAKVQFEDLYFLAELAEAGEYKPVIDKRYPFEQIADAHRHVDTGHKIGNVVVLMNLGNSSLDGR